MTTNICLFYICRTTIGPLAFVCSHLQNDRDHQNCLHTCMQNDDDNQKLFCLHLQNDQDYQNCFDYIRRTTKTTKIVLITSVRPTIIVLLASVERLGLPALFCLHLQNDQDYQNCFVYICKTPRTIRIVLFTSVERLGLSALFCLHLQND